MEAAESSAMITSILMFGNLILASTNLIIGFSLFAYVLTHNFRSPVARAFCALMAFITAVFIADVSLSSVNMPEAANIWLRFQWIGIAFVPAACFHFSDALLRTTGAVSRWRRSGVIGFYLLGLVAFVTAAFTNYLVDGIAQRGAVYHLLAGPLFWIFALYYAVVSVIGWFNVRRARARCLTSTSRRRMSYLMLAFIAPGIGVFPFLLVPTAADHFASNVVSLLTLISNAGIALMTVVIGYSVAYQGVLLPDRVVKHSLIHYLLRGPLVSICMVVIMLTIPRVRQILGLPRDTVLIVSVAGSVVILQLFINVAKPAIDRLIYRKDRKEMAWIQSLDRHLLTTTDLEQLLENTLIALCDLLRVPSGFIVSVQGGALAIHVFCGPREAAEQFLAGAALPTLFDALGKSRPEELIVNADFVNADGHWLLPLRSRNDKAMLGLLGISALSQAAQFSAEELEATYALVRRAERALEDMRLQQQIFAVLQGLGSELDQIQEWRSIPRYVGEADIQRMMLDPNHTAGFIQAVKDALNQYWGGPKLSQSPLLALRTVREKLYEHNNVPAKAVRAVLQEAIERLKPTGERSMTSSEWMVYNILDLKFVQGQRIREIAPRLAMSESDFYRKQRIAIEQVADTLIQMERSHEGE
jgi:hypothetical protein